MRAPLRALRLSTIGVAAAVLTACAGPVAPTPLPAISQPPDPFKSVLQPLDLDATWWYTDPAQPGPFAFVNTVIGEDTVNGQPVRLLQLNFAEANTIRLACIVQDGDVYVVATSVPGLGGWVRTVLDEPVLYRPGPGERTWTSAAFEAAEGAGEWRQAATGEQEVLGAARAAWQAQRTVRVADRDLVQTETRAERIGLIRQATSAPDGSDAVTLELTRFNEPELAFESPVWAGIGPKGDGSAFLWALDLSAESPRFETPFGVVTLPPLRAEQSRLSFEATFGSSPLTWTGRVSPAGLSGIARSGDLEFVLDFRPHPELRPTPEASPGSASPAPSSPAPSAAAG